MKSIFELEKDELKTLLNKDITEIKVEFQYNQEFKEDCEAELYHLEKEMLKKQKRNTDTKEFYLERAYMLEEWIAWHCLC